MTERAIREAVRGGAEDPSAVGDHCSAGTGCGGCGELVEFIVRSEQLALRCAARVAGAVRSPVSTRASGRIDGAEPQIEPISVAFG